ncbi:MAG TPA: S41 family peptidase [Roseiarcus sp.]|jgi:carboxyl-terminal processing protease|nr:S41 family peptidase [Roseiarcus sp.]
MKPTRREILAFAASLALGAPQAGAQSDFQLRGRGFGEADRSAFDQVWELVRDRFYDPRLNGLDWPAKRDRYRPQAEAAGSRDKLAAIINAMLAELGASHTRYYTQDDPAYYQLADIFSGALEHRGLRRIFASGEVSYPGIGIFTESDDLARTFLTGVIQGGPAHKASLLVGDEILSADDRPFRPVASFRGKVGTPVSLSVRRTRDGSPTSIAVVPADLHPNAMFLDGLKVSARVIDAGANARIGYVHVWSYAGWQYQRALEDLIAEGPLRDADALIWDLRDGWGGAQPQYLDLFNPHSPTMKVTARDGETGLVDVKWRKPVAALINGGTRSGKEVLAYGFKEYRLGELIGARTEGAVLAATAFLIGDDGLLLLAVDDVVVDGKRLEGAGVEPTIEVAFDPRYAAGADPQLDRAVQVLSRS